MYCNIAIHNLGDALDRIIVHKRVAERHPGLSPEDVAAAWNTAVVSAPRLSKNPDQYVALGFDGKGRLLEMAAVRTDSGDWLVFHAMTPPTDGTFRELGIERRP